MSQTFSTFQISDAPRPLKMSRYIGKKQLRTDVKNLPGILQGIFAMVVVAQIKIAAYNMPKRFILR